MGDFACDVCGKQFASKANVKRHVRQIHKTEPISCSSINKTISCTVCSNVLPSRIRLVEHLQSQHSIQITTSKYTFRTKEEFHTWKESTERETCSFYVSTTSSTNGGKKTKFYTCHRSGFHRRMGEKRNLKRKGSNKINGTCPAHIKMVQNVDGTGKLCVTYMSTHVGHTNDVGRMRLTAQERKTIAEQLQQGIPNNKILTNVHENLELTKRLTYLTKKDLHNIRASFNLKSEVKLDSEELNKIGNFIHKSSQSENNPILAYKPIGKLCEEFPFLKENDFFLVYMSDFQMEICQHYGDNIILCSVTHGTNPYKICLFTLFVVDDNGDGFPVSFMYSTSELEDVYVALFNLVKTRLGDLSPMSFISDDEPAVYKAWVKVFGQPIKKLLSTPNFKCDWNQNLILKVKNQEKLTEVQSELYSLQEEADSDNFEHNLNRHIAKWKQETESSSFGNYFESKYATRWKEWAACHRKISELNTHGCVDSWQQDLKAKTSINQQTMDGTIRHLVNCLNRKFSNIILSNISRPFFGKLSQLRNCASIETVELIIQMQEINKKWAVSSNNEVQPSETFHVDLLRNNNLAWKKKRTCDVCGVSVYGFSCTCNMAKNDMKLCEHLHYVCLVFGLGDRRGNQIGKCQSNQTFQTGIEAVTDETNAQLSNILDSLKTYINKCTRVKQLEEVRQQWSVIKDLVDSKVNAHSKAQIARKQSAKCGTEDDKEKHESYIVLYKTLPLNVYTCQFKSLNSDGDEPTTIQTVEVLPPQPSN